MCVRYFYPYRVIDTYLYNVLLITEVFLFLLAGLKSDGNIHSLMSFQCISFKLQRVTEILSGKDSCKICKSQGKVYNNQVSSPNMSRSRNRSASSWAAPWKAVAIILNQQWIYIKNTKISVREANKGKMPVSSLLEIMLFHRGERTLCKPVFFRIS